jgi:hypothetical protein
MANESDPTTFPTVQQFKQILLSESTEKIVNRYIFSEPSFVFKEKPELIGLMRKHLCKHLDLTEEKIVIVGSAKLGFSMSPDNFPREFSPESDIDVLVVDTVLFDSIWMTLLKWWYPRRTIQLGGMENKWASARRKDVFWGWVVPDEIRYEGISFPDVLKPIQDISASWFNAFKSLSLHPELADRNVNGRLYRTWEHATRYHSDGLRQISIKLKETEPEGK